MDSLVPKLKPFPKRKPGRYTMEELSKPDPQMQAMKLARQALDAKVVEFGHACLACHEIPTDYRRKAAEDRAGEILELVGIEARGSIEARIERPGYSVEVEIRVDNGWVNLYILKTRTADWSLGAGSSN